MTTQIPTFSGTLLLASVIEPEEIGRRIKRAREKKGWSQLTLAMEADVSPSTVSRWERGYLPPVRELIRLAEVLEIEPDELVEAAPDEQSELSLLRSEVAEVRGLLQELLAQRPDTYQHPDTGPTS